MFWVIVAPLYFVLAAVAPSILGLFVNRARPNFRTLSLSLSAVFVVIALICLAATSYVHVDSDEIAVLNKIYGTTSLPGSMACAKTPSMPVSCSSSWASPVPSWRS